MVQKVAVCYQRYRPYGPYLYDRFCRAYERLDAGVKHGFFVMDRPDEGQGGSDLIDYRKAVDDVEADAYCFLNCHSEPLCDGWLQRLTEALAGDVGIVGATGSYEAAGLAFPNPHIRTNAFMLRRETVLAVEWDVRDKQTAWALECGPRSLTQQIGQMGLRALVVGRDGTYGVDDWPKAGTFRQGEQANLLVADNRTRDYRNGDDGYRMFLSKLAWG